MKIAIWYHSLLFYGTPPELSPVAFTIVCDQMAQLETSGLLNATDELNVGVNGGEESREFARIALPEKARVNYNGLDCRNENKTLVLMEKWVKSHTDWYVLWIHAKGCTHPHADPMRTKWRECMMRNLVTNWRRCVSDLDYGYESVGCHWMTGKDTPPGQSIWAGNFFWAKASFLATLPSIMERDRIKESGLGSLESRYEAEVWIGNGPRLPRIKDYHANWNPSMIGTCA